MSKKTRGRVSSPKKETKRRRLFFDIETSPNIGYFWRAGYDLKVLHDCIIKERAIITICWKWAGERKVHYLTWDKSQNDKTMVRRFAKELARADEIVAHNGDNFDIKWFRTRCLLHGVSFPPTVPTVDTLKLARSKFSFNSNKLDYIAKFLGVGGKVETGGFQTWKDIVWNKDAKALAKMVRYCKNDVVILEKVFDKLMPYAPHKTNFANTTRECPECGSNNVIINRYSKTAAGYKKVTFKCKDCGKYHTLARSRFENEKLI